VTDEAAGNGDGHGSRPLIAVVDDEAAIVAWVVRALERAGYRVDWGRDGGDAVSLRFGEPSPDVMLLNWRMPRVSGDEALDLIRERELREGLPRLPIAFESGDASELEGLARDHGADAWIAAPFTIPELLALIERLLAMRGDEAR
jgi:two-component system, OmpR family, phosphate regulon response regulator PhoB